MKPILAAILISLAGASALADQCAYITKQQAVKAIAALAKAENYREFCAPCGDPASGEKQIGELTMKRVNYVEPYWEVSINGASIDLAYTYVSGKNLAKIANCPAKDVPETIK